MCINLKQTMGGIVCCLYFSLCFYNGSFAFYAIQQVAQAGWSPVLFSVMQEFLLLHGFFNVLVLLLCGLHFAIVFYGWFHSSRHYSVKLIATKSGY
jgi:hypothetical protein